MLKNDRALGYLFLVAGVLVAFLGIKFTGFLVFIGALLMFIGFFFLAKQFLKNLIIDIQNLWHKIK